MRTFLPTHRLTSTLGPVLVAALIAMAVGCKTDAPNAPDPDPIPADLDPYERNSRLSRGINLGNALEAPAEGEWGIVLQEEYFTTIRQAGFESVRIPIRWSAHAGTTAPFAIEARFMDRVQWAVDTALENGLAVVINMHHYLEMFDEPQTQRARFLAMWEQIAARFRTYDGDLMFELLNEPNSDLTPPLWNDMLAEVIALIRETNPERILIVGPAEWGGIGSLDKLVLPESDKDLIVSFHYYSPFPFTHQGAEWVPGSDSWLGTRWRGTLSEEVAVGLDLQRAVDWGRANDRPLYMGEFGAYSKADMPSRVRWTAHVARTAEQGGVSWAYWEFASGFGAYDPSARSWRQALLEALVPPAAAVSGKRVVQR